MRVQIENNLNGKTVIVPARWVSSTGTSTLYEITDPISGAPFPVAHCVWFSNDCNVLAGMYVTYTLIR